MKKFAFITLIVLALCNVAEAINTKERTETKSELK